MMKTMNTTAAMTIADWASRLRRYAAIPTLPACRRNRPGVAGTTTLAAGAKAVNGPNAGSAATFGRGAGLRARGCASPVHADPLRAGRRAPGKWRRAACAPLPAIRGADV